MPIPSFNPIFARQNGLKFIQMQNNSLVKVFGVLFALVSIYQLSFTFISSSVESQAENFAKQAVSEDTTNYLEARDEKITNYLDSIGNNSIYGFTSYNDSKSKELNLSLIHI